jgi:hypothetical protein
MASRCSLLLGLIGLLIALGPARELSWAQEAPAAESGPGSLRDYVLKTQSRQAYGVYFRGRKLGWAIGESRLGTLDGREVAIDRFQLHFVLQTESGRSQTELNSVTTYSLDGEGAVLAKEERTKEDGNEIVQQAVREGKGLRVTVRSRGGTQERRTPAPRETLGQARRLHQWLTANPRKGATIEQYTSSLTDEELNTRMVVSYQGRRTIVWGGVPTEIYAVRISLQGATFDAEMKANGMPIKGRLGGTFELRAEEEATAKRLDARGLALLAASSIPVRARMGDPARVTGLTLEARGLGTFSPPESHRQRVRRRSAGAVVLELSRDHRAPKRTPLSAAQRAQHLRATVTLPANEESIRKLASQIVGDEKEPVKAAGRLQRWVYRSLRKTMASNATTALEVLATRAGDCTEHTLLMVALARAAGIPAKEVAGVAYTPAPQPCFAWHAWAEIHDGAQWVTIDPTWNQVYVDATHVKLSDGSSDFAWMDLLGGLGLKVVRFKTGK